MSEPIRAVAKKFEQFVEQLQFDKSTLSNLTAAIFKNPTFIFTILHSNKAKTLN
jgi:hypothetical protein